MKYNIEKIINAGLKLRIKNKEYEKNKSKEILKEMAELSDIIDSESEEIKHFLFKNY